MRRLIAIPLLLALGSCSDTDPTPIVNITSPTAPTPSPPPACQVNQTATVSFQNHGFVFVDVIWDGLYIGTLPPLGTQGFEQSVAANVPHRLDWRETNTMLMPCPESRPILVQCSKVILDSCYGF